MSYKGGVYIHKTGSQLGGHAVKIIGWGEDYWIVANSWGSAWGLKGYFWFGMNQSCCAFEA